MVSSFFFCYMCAICSALNEGSVARVWFELTNSILNKTPQPKCKPLQTSSSRFPWQLTHFLVELIALAIFFFFFSFLSPAKQVALLVSFWLHLTDCISRLDRDDRMSFVPGAWPWVGDTVPGLSLVFWPTSDCVHVYLRVWQRQCGPLMWSQEAGGPEIQPDCVDNLWQVSLQGKQEI